MAEQLYEIVKPYPVGRSTDSLVVSIPKEVREKAGIKPGIRMYVKIDERGRIIYEPLRVEEVQVPS